MECFKLGFLLFLFICLKYGASKNVIAMTIVHSSDIDEYQQGAKQLTEFLGAVKSSGSICGVNVHCILFVPTAESRDIFLSTFTEEYHVLLDVIPNDSIRDNGIGKRNQDYEHVSGQINALQRTIDLVAKLDTTTEIKHNVLFLTFSPDSFPRNVPNLPLLFDFIKRRSGKSELTLLGKCGSMSSMSDWHDLMVVAFTVYSTATNDHFTSSPASEWLKVFREVYQSHAHKHRLAFNLLDPRPAILEATFQVHRSKQLNVSYFNAGMISTKRTTVSEGDLDPFLMEIACEGRTPREKSICSTVDNLPQEATRKVLDIKEKTWEEKFRLKRKKKAAQLSEDQKYEEIVGQFDFGPNRYRFSNDDKRPKEFCWDNGDLVIEDFTTSRIYQNLQNWTNFSKPHNWQTIIPEQFVILTGNEIGLLDTYMYQSIGKAYYANRHGYKFSQKLSNQYVKYFGSNFLEDAPVGRLPYGMHVMSKIPMVLHTMYENPQAEWIFWCDADTWINPGWMDMPLDVYTHDVPPDKVFVLANFRSTFSNAFFIRNNEVGRQFARDWLAIAMSGYIQCHGYDQAALQLLMLSRMHSAGRHPPEVSRTIPVPLTPTPFNHTCLSKVWIEANNGSLPNGMKEEFPKKMSSKWQWGCGTSSTWSCDFNFEQTLWRLGFESSSFRFHHNELSSFSKGCANDYIPFVHIAPENSYRPRLHCEYCDTLSEIEATSQKHDGPLGGGNDWVRRGAVNGYFLNHKLHYPFYDSYTIPSSCKQNKVFIRDCDPHDVEVLLERLQKQSKSPRLHKRMRRTHTLLSLADGFALDVEEGQFCKGDVALYNYQMANTYMKDYEDIIRAVKKIPEAKWNKMYKQSLMDKGFLEFRPRYQWYETMFFEVENFCDKCKEQVNEEYLYARDVQNTARNNDEGLDSVKIKNTRKPSTLNCKRPYGE